MTRRRSNREGIVERRDDAKRRAVEMVLDRFFRPANWAARTAYTLGLQSARPVHVDRYKLEREGVAPLRIAFASDFHAGATTAHRVLEDACATLDALEPDVLLLGGDFVSVRGNDIHALADLLANVRAPLGKFGVYGNHDLRANHKEIGAALGRAGVRMLVNEVVRVGDVSIVGMDDPIIGSPRGEILDDATGVRVLLMHAPDGLLVAEHRHFDLALCGHTHGGQIVVPGGLIPYLPHGDLSRAYPVGKYRVGDGTLIVSRGVGCSTVPVRVCCPAEVHLIEVG
ncbi:MAG: metallophosphoesterase [Gemmatimonadaceae bacterium]